MLSHRPSTAARRTGAHMVEFAIVAPLFFLFVFTMIDIGRALMVNSLLTNAARAGCRTGTLPGKANSDVNAAVSQSLSSVGVLGQTVTIQVNGKGSTDVSKANTKDLVSVSVSVPAGNVSWLPMAWFVGGNLSGQFVLEHE